MLIRRITLVDLILIGITLFLAYTLFINYKDALALFTNTYNQKILLLFIFNVLLFRYYLQFQLYRILYHQSIAKVDRNIVQHYNVGIFGAIGSKKSANGTAITQMAEGILINDLHERLYKINLFLQKYIDFVDLEYYIQNEFPYHLVHTDFKRKKFAYDYLRARGFSPKDIDFKVKDNSFSLSQFIELLGEYLELKYYSYFRNNYIQANTGIVSVNTGNMCIPMSESQFQIYRPNDRAYERFQITFKDEAGIVDNSRVSARRDKDSIKINDDGKDVENMLQRHFGKGKNLRLTIAQSEKDVTADRRRLFNRSLELYTSEDIFLFDFELNLIKWIAFKLINKETKKQNRKMKKANLIYKLNTIFKKRFLDKYVFYLVNKFEHYTIKSNNYKKVLLVLEKIHIFFGQYLYLYQNMMVHDDADNIGKTPEHLINNGKSFPMHLIYPAKITYGKYSTYSYFRLIDERNANATVPCAIVPPFKKLTMSKEEHLSMGFKAINRIQEAIDNPEDATLVKVSVVKKEETNNKKIDKTSIMDLF